MRRPSTVPRRAVLHVATEAILERDPAGRIWSGRSLPIGQWALRNQAFDAVRLVVRVADVVEAAGEALVLDPNGLTVLPLPAYRGLGGFLAVSIRLCRCLWIEAADVDLALLRLPGPIGTVFGLCLVLRRRKYAVQLVGDVDAVFDSSGFGPATRLMRLPLVWCTRYLCKSAKLVTYVTRAALQARYPCGVNAAQFAFSNVEVARSSFASGPRDTRPTAPFQLVFCGSLAQRYKGLDVLIDAVRRLANRGIDIHLTVIGEGRFRPQLAEIATSLGVSNRLTFVGQVAHSTVLTILERADLFVLPSLTEGLPRALVEAMAKGLPCVASRVGGVPELLSDRALVPPGDPGALAQAIESFLSTPDILSSESARNLERAHAFDSGDLNPERSRFLDKLRRYADQG